MSQEPILIAEIGCNHKGEMDIAHEMIKISAHYCKSDFVKFQKRNPRELLTEEEYNAPHPNPINSYGATYGEHRERLEFNLDQHMQLKRWCEEEGIDYSVSVWDLTSAKEMAELKPKHIKIPSACNLKADMMGWLFKNYDGEIHISLGMTTQEEEKKIFEWVKESGRGKDTIFYSCTSGYPVPFEDICLLEITRLQETFGSELKGIAFSGHHLGIAADIAAISLGAKWVERHFTLDRTWKGTDHAASLEPDGLRKLKRDLSNVSKALTYKSTDLLEIEKPQRDKLKRL